VSAKPGDDAMATGDRDRGSIARMDFVRQLRATSQGHHRADWPLSNPSERK